MSDLSQNVAKLNINDKENGNDGGKPSYVPPHLRGSGKPAFREPVPQGRIEVQVEDSLVVRASRPAIMTVFLVFLKETMEDRLITAEAVQVSSHQETDG